MSVERASLIDPKRRIRAALMAQRRRRERAEQRLEHIRAEQDELVATAIDAGLDIAHVARCLGVSRWTIYNRRKETR